MYITEKELNALEEAAQLVASHIHGGAEDYKYWNEIHEHLFNVSEKARRQVNKRKRKQ